MSLFDKIKTAVRGNPVTRDYELDRHIASAGPGLLWKVHSGVKKTTRQEVSIFVFNKKAPEFEKLTKKQREALYEMLKKGPTQLIKLRHPRLLTIEHQVAESSDTLAFVTEPIFASLANLLGHYDNMPAPLPLIIKEYQLHPIEVQFGLFRVAEALNFLHSGVKMVHGNLTPSNVAVNSRGVWKLLGFNFCCYSQHQINAQKSFAFQEWDTHGPSHNNPSLDYLAPEYMLSQSCSTASDVYSFGMLCHSVYNSGRPLFESNNNLMSFKQNTELVSRISESALCDVPMELKGLVRSTLAVEPRVRPDTLEITKHVFFDEAAISTLKYLDTLFEKKDIEKSQFFKKNLVRVITKLPKRMVHQHVLPPLSEEFRNHKMIPFVLPLVLLIAEDCTLAEFAGLVLPVLTPAMKVLEPIQIPLIFLQKMDLLLKLTCRDAVQEHILPMIFKSLEAENCQVQELCVSVLPSFASMVDYSSMKHSIIPRITALCRDAKVNTLQVKCLVCLGLLLDILDKHILLDEILPTLHQIPSREPGVLMAILGIFHQTLTRPKLGLDKKILAETVVPFLLPLSIEPCLNLKQFRQFVKVIHEMLAKLESEQEAYLEQLTSMEEQTKSTVNFAREVTENKSMDNAINRLQDMFTTVDPVQNVGVAKRGADTSSRSPVTMLAAGSGGLTGDMTGKSGSENSSFLSGISLADLSNTFSRNSTYPVTTATPTQSSVTSILHSTAPANQPSPQSEPFQPTMGVSSYHAPPLMPAQNISSSQCVGMDMLFGPVNGRSESMSSTVNSSSVWSAGSAVMGPSGSTTNNSNSASSGTWSSYLHSSTIANNDRSSVQAQFSKESASIFSGLDAHSSTGSSFQPSSTARGNSSCNFERMNLYQNQSSPYISQSEVTTQQNLVASCGGIMAQPLVPTNIGGGNSLSGTGWSSNAQHSSGVGHKQAWSEGGASQVPGNSQPGLHYSQVSGWSSNISGMDSENVGYRISGSGWSQGIGANPAGMGLNPSSIGTNQTNLGKMSGVYQKPTQSGNMGMGSMNPTHGTGMNWSSDMQQPGQPLIPTTGGWGQSPSSFTQQQHQAPGTNPFADLSFLG